MENKTKEEVEEKGLMPCDNYDDCGNLAQYNLQSGWVIWKVRKNGGYSRNPSTKFQVDDNDNEHLCEDCANNEGWDI